MNRAAQILMEYLPPHKAEEMMARLHACLPDNHEERTKFLNQIHKDLHEEAIIYLENFINKSR